jgi:hypothetical protein
MLTPASARVRVKVARVPGRDTRLSVSWVVLGIAGLLVEVVGTGACSERAKGSLLLSRSARRAHVEADAARIL